MARQKVVKNGDGGPMQDHEKVTSRAVAYRRQVAARLGYRSMPAALVHMNVGELRYVDDHAFVLRDLIGGSALVSERRMREAVDAHRANLPNGDVFYIEEEPCTIEPCSWFACIK